MIGEPPSSDGAVQLTIVSVPLLTRDEGETRKTRWFLMVVSLFKWPIFGHNHDVEQPNQYKCINLFPRYPHEVVGWLLLVYVIFVGALRFNSPFLKYLNLSWFFCVRRPLQMSILTKVPESTFTNSHKAISMVRFGDCLSPLRCSCHRCTPLRTRVVCEGDCGGLMSLPGTEH